MTEGLGRLASSPGTRRGAREGREGRNRWRAWQQARPEMKGDGGFSAIEDELARFFRRGCISHQGRAPGALVMAWGGL
jgi:hypothetical protein